MSMSLPISAIMLTATTADGEPLLILACDSVEWHDWSSESRSISQGQLERLHLDRFRADALADGGVDPLVDAEPGDDPPDFIVRDTAGVSRGLDCSTYGLSQRRTAHTLFEQLQVRLAAGAGGRSFDGIQGCVLGVWFGSTLDDLPPRRSDDTIIKPLLDAMADCVVDREALADYFAETGGRPPTVGSQGPPLSKGEISDGLAGFVANVVAPTGIGLGDGLGFAVQLTMGDRVPLSRALGVLQKLVTDHDKAEISHLLVSAGAPDRRGRRFVGEEAVARFLLDHGEVTVRANCIERVSVHLWGERSIHEIRVEQGGPEQGQSSLDS
jgi:hypothetical protein